VSALSCLRILSGTRDVAPSDADKTITNLFAYFFFLKCHIEAHLEVVQEYSSPRQRVAQGDQALQEDVELAAGLFDVGHRAFQFGVAAAQTDQLVQELRVA